MSKHSEWNKSCFSSVSRKKFTEIREADFGTEAKPCHKVLDVHVDTLCLCFLMQQLPTGHPIVMKCDNGFIPQRTGEESKTADGWLEWI